MFMATGSTTMAATSSACSRAIARVASRSLYGATRVRAATSARMPGPAGVEFGRSAGPATSRRGFTPTSRVSWDPWYEPSNLITVPWPVTARAIRTAWWVASRPVELKRTWSMPNRSQIRSATSGVRYHS